MPMVPNYTKGYALPADPAFFGGRFAYSSSSAAMTSSVMSMVL